MAVKQDIIDLINANLADASNILASQHRQALHSDVDSIVENFYPSEIQDNPGTTLVVTKNNVSNNYLLRITKQGRKVTINGTYSGVDETFGEMFQITNLDFQPEPASNYYGSGTTFSGDVVPIQLNGFSLFASQLLSSETLRFNFTYNTKD